MSIPENKARGAKTILREEDYPEGLVVPESQIRKLIVRAPVKSVERLATRFQVVADATSAVYGRQAKELTASQLKIIKQIGRGSKSRAYQKIVRAMMAAINRGTEGIVAAHETAAFAVETAFRWSEDYFLALRGYKAKLRKNKVG